MKVILYFMIALPLSVSAQLTLKNSSFSNGFGTGSDGVNSLTTALGSTSSLVLNTPIEPPVINSFSPQTGAIGTTLTLAGENFSAIPEENIVYFGATRAVVTSASTKEVSVAVPFGATYQPITITVNALTAYSTKPFSVTFPSNGVLNQNSFAEFITQPVGSNPLSIAIGDFNGDNRPDLAVVNLNHSVSILKNLSIPGISQIASKVDLIIGSPTKLAIGDIDGDGKLDLVTISKFNNTVSIFRNTTDLAALNPTISFAAKVDFQTGGLSPIDVAINDLDMDGRPDIVIANNQSNGVSVLRNESIPGNITQSSIVIRNIFSTGPNPSALALGNLDADGRPDLVVTHANNTATLFANQGSFTFAPRGNLLTGSFPADVEMSDLDGDNFPDLVVVNSNSSSISVFRNTSAPWTFANKVDFTTGPSPQALAISDFDGDGRADITVAIGGTHDGKSSVSLFKNTSSSGSVTSNSFDAKVDLYTPSPCTSVANADIDGDGKPDLAISNVGGTVSIIQNLVGPSIPPAMQIISGANVITNTPSSLYNVEYSIVNIGADFKIDFEINNSGEPLEVSSASITGVNSADFTLSIATLPHTILAGESLGFSITFSPNEEGFRTSEISFTSNDPDDNPYEFSLSGTGMKSGQTITFHPLDPQTYGNEPLALEATASSGLQVAYVSINTAVATVNENSITIVGAGETIITASQPGDAMFAPALEVQQTLVVSQAVLTTTADDKTKMYGETPDPLLTISYSGFKGIDDESVLNAAPTASTSVTATSDAGNYDIIPAGGSDNNYTFSYVYGKYTVNKLTLSATADDKTKNYGEENPAFTISYSGFVLNEDPSVVDVHPTILTTATQASAPGTYLLTPEGGSDNNYNFNLIVGTLTINPQENPPGGKPTSNCYLTSPENNSINVNYYVPLSSNKVVGAQLYTIEANTRADFSGMSIVKQGSSESIVFLLDYNTQYYARVKTDQAPDEWSVASTFVTGNPVSLAYVTSPIDRGTGVPSNVRVTANLLYGAAAYTIEVNTGKDFAGTSIVNTSESRTILFRGLAKATTYFARVSSNLRPGEWGTITSFSTINPGGRGREEWMGPSEEEMETDGVLYNVFPNPFNDGVTIHVQSLAQVPLEMTIFDMNGKDLERASAITNQAIVLGEGLASGMYILQIVTSHRIKNVRLIKF
ncbi:MAG: FG-GAP-like repeat-containing protein [Cyclobacteriaceae bacterium]